MEYTKTLAYFFLDGRIFFGKTSFSPSGKRKCRPLADGGRHFAHTPEAGGGGQSSPSSLPSSEPPPVPGVPLPCVLSPERPFTCL